MSDKLSEESVFKIAFGLESEELRDEYLKQVAEHHPTLCERVIALLKASDARPSFLESPALELEKTREQPAISESVGTSIGPYTLMEKIGEGGMGIVFVARQESPLRRKVALKVIKPGMDSKAVVARFEAERQALAIMDHPNIAKVLDAGTTDSGRPYFAMELVKGIPITAYCDKNRLTIEDRLELFMQVCQAIQHAHHKGIIHRDIKPSNVLVTLHDGKPVPKVIDFGVAKALNARLTDKTIYTEHFQVVGTLLYMSPEQAELSGLDVDTRSDVYSLGVLLYELLTGTTPFQEEELNQAGFDEQRRIIRDREPPRASVRISSLGETATAVAEHRKTDPKRLHDAVRGELDWVVLKALEKDRTRRYDSPGEFAADIDRYLNHDTVEAHPPSLAYRSRKYIARNKAGLATVSIVITALCVGLGIAYLQAVRARRIRDQAIEAERVARVEWERAQEELGRREKAEKQVAFQVQEAVRTHLAFGELDKAQELLEMAGKLRKDDGLAWALLDCQLLLARGDYGDYREALNQLTQLKQSNPGNMSLESMLAWTNARLAREEELYRAAEQLVKKAPAEFTDLLYRGIVLSNYWPKRALEDFTKAREDTPTSHILLLWEAQAYRNLAEVTYDAGESLKQARESINRLQSLRYYLPDNEMVWHQLALSYVIACCRCKELGLTQQEAEYRNAAEDALNKTSKESLEALYTRAMFQIMDGDLESIVADYERLGSSAEPGDWYLGCVASAYFGLNRDADAQATMRRATQEFQDGPGHRFIAIARLDDAAWVDLAQQYERRAVEFADDYSNPYHFFDWCFYRLLGDDVQAESVLDRIIEYGQDPWWRELQEMVWWVEFAKLMKTPVGARDESRIWPRKLTMRMSDLSVKFGWAVNCLANDEREKAIRHLRDGIAAGCPRAVLHWLSVAMVKRLELEPDWPQSQQSGEEF